MKRSVLLFHVFFIMLFELSDLQGSPEIFANDLLMQSALQNNDLELIEIIMKYGSDPSYPALNWAMESKDFLAVQILIEYGADTNSRREKHQISNKGSHWEGYHKIEGFGTTVLEKAIEFENIELIEYFLLKKADPLCRRKITDTFRKNNPAGSGFPGTSYTDQYETTAMYDAVKSGNLCAIILFDQYGIDLNAICYEEFSNNVQPRQVFLTPIQAAIKFHHKDIVAYLLSKGVKI